MQTAYTIFDIEANGLLGKADRIHCAAWQRYSGAKVLEKGTATDRNGIRKALEGSEWLVGHNILRYDIPLLREVIGLDLSGRGMIDTMALSWHLCPERKSHSLGAWGGDLGIAKPVVDDWESLSPGDYAIRCQADAEITTALFRKLMNMLHQVYGGDVPAMLRLCRHLADKMDCLAEQERHGIPLDMERCSRNLLEIESGIRGKALEIAGAMPKEIGRATATRPQNMFRRDGSLSAAGERWRQKTREAGLPMDAVEIKEPPSPESSSQVKQWLFAMGWKPMTYKASKATGRQVPQVSLPNGGGICPSVGELAEREPAILHLRGLYTMRHRAGLLRSFLNHQESGKVKATAHGLTNTLRLMHAAPIANLPKPETPWGREVREVLVAPEGQILCGADIAALEDSTKQHYIAEHDPEYVREMQRPGFDPHIDIGMLARIITPEEAALYKEWSQVQNPTDQQTKAYSRTKAQRATAKAANFAATYGAGPKTIAQTAKITIEQAQKLHRTYWERNWAIKKVAQQQTTKTIDRQKWILNPVSKMWVRFRDEKDRFSALNQSTGAYAFDTWINIARPKLREILIPVIMQYHDEILTIVPENKKEQVTKILQQSMKEACELLNIRVLLNTTLTWGPTYADCH